MNRYLIGCLAAAVLSLGAGVFAQETPPAAATPPVKPMTKHKMMKECMAREVSNNDGSTKAQKKKICKAEINNNMNIQDMLKH